MIRNPAFDKALFSVFFCWLIFPSTILGEEDYCNKDVLYNLPNFSDQAYLQKCQSGELTRIKKEKLKDFCDKQQAIEVISIHPKENNIVFQCHFLNVELAKRSIVYQWKDNFGNTQYTNTLPPADCTTEDCLQILKKWSEEKSIEILIKEAITRFEQRKNDTLAEERAAVRNKHPTVLDYLKSKESGSLCLQLATKDKKNNKFLSRLTDLYSLANSGLVVSALMLELSDRFKTSEADIKKLYQQPDSIWVGMEEALLNCSRPDPLIIYDNKGFFGASTRQYVYEVTPDYEYVDVYNGEVTKIWKEPMPPSLN